MGGVMGWSIDCSGGSSGWVSGRSPRDWFGCCQVRTEGSGWERLGSEASRGVSQGQGLRCHSWERACCGRHCKG